MTVLDKLSLECCGCQACAQSCPKDAITLKENVEGFLYPEISDACIHCGKCVKVCPIIEKPELSQPIEGYAAYLKERKALRGSSSGGIFVAVAEEILNKGGAVFGCAETTPGEPAHIVIRSREELPLLQGSKYTQSNMTGVYRQVQEILDTGIPVLFSGTPCQVAGLLKFTGKRENLFTADIICHGVPSRKLYKAYLSWLEKETGSTVKQFLFRSKEKHDWSLTYRVELEKDGRTRTQEKIATLSPYYSHFLKGMTYRESCYVCPYAQSNRPGDLTLGDFWGIERVLPDFYNPDGMSAVLVNTQKGKNLWSAISENVVAQPVDTGLIIQNNGQLKAPTKRSPARDSIYTLLSEEGYQAVSKSYRSKKELLIDTVKDLIPNRVRQNIKNLLKRAK